jgi:hypothetical protein
MIITFSKNEKRNYNLALRNIDTLTEELSENDKKKKAIQKKMDDIKLKPEYAFFPRGVV